MIAHLIALSTLLYQILETRSDTHNILALICKIRKAQKDGFALSAIEERVKALKPAWVKMSRIRNEVFAHRSSKSFTSKVFSEIQLTPDDIGHLIQNIKEIIRALAGIAGLTVPNALTLSATEDTERFMLYLAKCDAP